MTTTHACVRRSTILIGPGLQGHLQHLRAIRDSHPGVSWDSGETAIQTDRALRHAGETCRRMPRQHLHRERRRHLLQHRQHLHQLQRLCRQRLLNC